MQESDPSNPLPDIQGREDLQILVDDFYGRVRHDELLGFIFDEIAEVDWDHHIPKIVDFWETVLFRTGRYQGSPLLPHLRLAGMTDMSRERFQRWVELFGSTVDTHFSGPGADHLKNVALDMANVMSFRIAEVFGSA